MYSVIKIHTNTPHKYTLRPFSLHLRTTILGGGSGRRRWCRPRASPAPGGTRACCGSGRLLPTRRGPRTDRTYPPRGRRPWLRTHPRVTLLQTNCAPPPPPNNNKKPRTTKTKRGSEERAGKSRGSGDKGVGGLQDVSSVGVGFFKSCVMRGGYYAFEVFRFQAFYQVYGDFATTGVLVIPSPAPELGSRSEISPTSSLRLNASLGGVRSGERGTG